ncbi:MICOS complex subunit MIC60 [Aeromonas media]|uniref:hypothetical protein n=1 Tax=Aeromonas media TaxID=651 RepID=UPI0029542C19|nr:hypothetical protein [Aeromonas media]WOQ15169.1 hypothetical protein R2X36_10130 [Aeromonas media]
MKTQIITLKLESKEITLTTHNVEDQQLFKAQDLLKGYGLSSDEANDKVRNWKVSQESKAVNFTVLTFKGKYGGTYLTKRQILKLAGYVSYEFEDAVYEAFEMLMDGNGNGAIEKALSVAVVHKVMLQDRPTPTLKKMYKESGMKIDEFVSHILKNSTLNNKADVDDRKKLANALLNVVDDIVVGGKNVADDALRILSAQKEIHQYRAMKFAQSANYKKTLALKSNRKLVRQSEALERMIDEAQAELEQVRIKARMIGSIALADRKMKNELELQIIDLEEHIEDLKAQREEIPF